MNALLVSHHWSRQADPWGRIAHLWQNKLNARLFGEESANVGFEDHETDISSMADRDPILTVNKNGQRHFSQMAWIDKEADDRHDMEATVEASDGS